MACSCRTCRSPSEWMIDLDASLVERNFREKTLLASWTRLPLTPKAEPNASSAPRKKATDIGRRARGHSAPESDRYFSFYIMACQHKGQLMLTFSSMIS